MDAAQWTTPLIEALERTSTGTWVLLGFVGGGLLLATAVGLVIALARLRRSLRAHREMFEYAHKSVADAMLERTGDLVHRHRDDMRDLRESVSEQLARVQRGVGEIQGLAGGLTELQRTLANVKKRGAWGEAQLEHLLSDFLTPDQYALQVTLRSSSQERVDAALKLRSAEDQPFDLPIDAKFPVEDYLRLLDARERADAAAEAQASRQLASRVRSEARRIFDKYVHPPETTDFAVLFVPTESLYAEIVRIPGLLQELQRACSVTLAGPANLVAILSAIRMGLRAVALKNHAGEIWKQLGVVQTELDQLLGQLERTRRQLGAATRSLETAERHAGSLQEQLASTERLPDRAAAS